MQLLELSSLQMKRLQPVADQEQVKEAIMSKDHPFWNAFALAVATLEKVQTTTEQVLKMIKQITSEVITAKRKANCFVDKYRYYYRDGNLVNWLPETQAEQSATSFSVNELLKKSTFKAMAEEIVGEKGNIKKISQILISRKHTTSLPAIESLIERQDGGENVGLQTDGRSNFFFVENVDGGVSVIYMFRADVQWFVHVFRLGNGRRWYAGDRVFVRNS